MGAWGIFAQIKPTAVLSCCSTVRQATCQSASFYPQAEANSEELVGTHLGPRPVAKLLAIGDRQHGLVLPVAEGRAGALQHGFLLHTQAGGQHRQQGHHRQQEGHVFFPTAALQPRKPACGRQLLASYSLQSLELLRGWIIDRLAH